MKQVGWSPSASARERVDHRLDVMAAEIGHQRAQFVVRQRVDDRARLGAAEIGQQRLAPRRRRPGRSAPNRGCSGSRRSSARSASPPSRANAASSLRPYLMVTTFQPMSRNRPSMRPNSRSGTTLIEALAVVVDDPPDDCGRRASSLPAAPRRCCPRRVRHRRRWRCGGRAAGRCGPARAAAHSPPSARENVVIATPSPTEPVEKSTSGAVLHPRRDRTGRRRTGAAPAIFSRVCRPNR